MYTVYKHTTPNGKVYIGITSINPLDRWRNGFGYYQNKHFYNAILKYGWDNIKHEILFTNLDEDEAYEKEIELIALYKSNNPKFGYNKSTGGEHSNFGHIHSEESKIKMSISHMGNTSRKGTHISEETKEKLRQANLGKHHSEETKRKLSESLKGKNTGKPSIRAKRVICIETCEEFPNMVLACEYANSKHVRSVCNGKRKTAGGYHWRYVDE